MIPFTQKNQLFGDFENKIIFNTKTTNLEDLDFLLENATSKMVSIENKSIVDYLINKFEAISLSFDDLEEKLLSHYGDTIILLNPTIAPLIPNAIKVQENIYFTNEIQDHIICIDNRDNCLYIEEHFELRNRNGTYGLISSKLLIINAEGIKIYKLK
nr:hypothetical protein [Methanobrevibacter arboriphilus]